MNQNSTTDTLIAFALVFGAGLLCAKLIKGYCRSKQQPCTREPSTTTKAIPDQSK